MKGFDDRWSDRIFLFKNMCVGYLFMTFTERPSMF